MSPGVVRKSESGVLEDPHKTSQNALWRRAGSDLAKAKAVSRKYLDIHGTRDLIGKKCSQPERPDTNDQPASRHSHKSIDKIIREWNEDMQWAALNARAARDTKRERAKIAKERRREEAQAAKEESKEGGDTPKPVGPSRGLVRYFQQNQAIDEANRKRKAEDELSDMERALKKKFGSVMTGNDIKTSKEELGGNRTLKRKAEDDGAGVSASPAKRPNLPTSEDDTKASKEERGGKKILKRKVEDDDAEVSSRPAKRPHLPTSAGYEIVAKVHIEGPKWGARRHVRLSSLPEAETRTRQPESVSQCARSNPAKQPRKSPKSIWMAFDARRQKLKLRKPFSASIKSSGEEDFLTAFCPTAGAVRQSPDQRWTFEQP